MNRAFTQELEGARKPILLHSVKCLIVEMFSAQPIKDNEESFDSFKESHSVASHKNMIWVQVANAYRPQNEKGQCQLGKAVTLLIA